jgi:hypothetical protein
MIRQNDEMATKRKNSTIITGFCILIALGAAIAACTAPDSGTATVQTPAISTPAGTSGQTNPSQVTPSVMPATTVPENILRGTPDPAFVVDIAVPEKIGPGTTILADNHNPASPRIIEVNRLGEIVWEYSLPDNLKEYTNPGWDVEPLPNGNILTVLPRNGVYEINRNKQVVWKYLDSKVSHDADRLANGNTLVAFGAYDTADDAQVKEIDPSGKRVWSWYAKDVFTGPEYTKISSEGWTHTNAVTRLDSGNTLISLRNFNFIAEVGPDGKLVRKIGEGLFADQHDPLVLPDGNLLVANHEMPNEVLELDPAGEVVWRFPVRDRASMPVRDANRLPNGNTLITEADRIVEVTKYKQIVWQFRLTMPPFTDRLAASSQGFYKAERISP